MKMAVNCKTLKRNTESMKKIFILAALALTLAACSKPESEIRPAENDGMITLTATLAPKGAATKALTDDGDGKLNAYWAENEELAILYKVGGENKIATATVTEVDAVTGAATIAFTVESGTEEGTACTVIYPATAAKDDATDVKSNADLIGNQPGMLDAKLDVRVTTGTISLVTPEAGLVLDTPLAPKYAIVKFTLQNTDGNPISAKSLAVTIGNDAFVATPGTAASEFYLALPAVSSGTLIFSVPGNEGTSSYCSSKAITKNIEAGKFYRSTVLMTVQSDNADYVPMGDGLKWALKNVGASSPADYGDYFAWGETEPYYSSQSPLTWKDGKSGGYYWSSYGFTNTDDGSTFTKYCPTDKTDYWGGEGGPDNLLVLQSTDDAAYAASSGKFRMPTIEEWQALLKAEDFTWAWVENFNGSGNSGRLVISKKSGVMGNCIFLPAAGARSAANLRSAGSNGSYWSSSLCTNYVCAHALYFGPGYAGWADDMRYAGYSVRPVQTAE